MATDCRKNYDIGGTGCLLIHGFGGNVAEVQPLADRLLLEGYRVECPSLKGHTGISKDLKHCTYHEWINSAQEGLTILQKECKAVVLIGFSMGGLIAFQLARTNRIDAIVTLNTPIYYWDLKRIFLNVIADVGAGKTTNLHRYFSSSSRFPFNALLNFRLLLSKTKPILGWIKCPVFIVQALQDDTVRKSSADYIYRNIGSLQKRSKFYNESGHLILLSKAAGEVMADVENFIRQVKT